MKKKKILKSDIHFCIFMREKKKGIIAIMWINKQLPLFCKMTAHRRLFIETAFESSG